MLLKNRRFVSLICSGLTALLFIMLSLHYQDVRSIHFVDSKLESLLYNFLGDSWVPVFTLITNLGSGRICIPITAILIVYFVIAKKYWIVPLLLFNVFCVRWINHFLKAIYERPRPHVEHLVRVSYYSFPSGHAMDSTAFYGFLAFLLHVQLKKAGKSSSIVWIAAFILILLICLSRVYLGAHYPTDVIGGFLAGACCLSITILLYTLIPCSKK